MKPYKLIAFVALLAFILCVASYRGQTTGALLPALPPAFTNQLGVAASAAKLCSFAAGTTTPKSLFSDSALTTAVPNPNTLNSLGQPTSNGSTAVPLYMNNVSGNYKIILYQAGATGASCPLTGTAIWSRDNVYDPALLTAFDNVQLCDRFTGANAGAKIAACITALPSTGGVADARGIQGAQTLGTLTISKNNVKLLLGAASYTGNIVATADGIIVDGLGRGATIITLTAAANVPVFLANGAGTPAVNVNNIQIRNLTLDGNKTNETVNQAGLFFKFCTKCIAENVEVQNSRDIGFASGDGSQAGPTSQEIKFVNGWSHDNRGNGVDVNNSRAIIINGMASWANGVASTIFAAGIFVGENSDSDILVANNITHDNAGPGIQASFNVPSPAVNIPATRFLVNNNISYSNGLQGIACGGAGAFAGIRGICVVSGNIVYSNGKYPGASASVRSGIYFDYALNVIATSNFSFNQTGDTSQQYGLNLTNGTGAIVSDMYFTGNSTGEVNIDNLSTHSLMNVGGQQNQLQASLKLLSASTLNWNGDAFLGRKGANNLELGPNGTASQTLSIYGNATKRLDLSHDGTEGVINDSNGQGTAFQIAGVTKWWVPDSSGALRPDVTLAVTVGTPSNVVADVYTQVVDFTTTLQANLGTPANGRTVICSDCTVTGAGDNTCAGGGNGALAVRLNGVWRCFNAQN